MKFKHFFACMLAAATVVVVSCEKPEPQPEEPQEKPEEKPEDKPAEPTLAVSQGNI